MTEFIAEKQSDHKMQEFAQRAMRIIFNRAGIIVPPHRENAIFRLLMSLDSAHEKKGIAALLDALERDPNHKAWSSFISGFTINHTAFFREPHHFNHLENTLRKKGQCKIWCAASSTGEEPYSIAMVVNEVFGEQASFPSILATDIDDAALAKARRGNYRVDRISSLSEDRVKRHFLKGIEENKDYVRVKNSVQKRVTFDSFNLNNSNWTNLGLFDIVFCRNTMIYFDQSAQTQLLKRFASVIKPGGHLYIGHSESVTAITNQFRLLGQTVYERI